MAGVFLQDVVVALVAFGAAAVVLRRLIGFAAAQRAPRCASCASGACAPSPASSASAVTPSAAAGTHPLVVVRAPQR